MDAPRQRAVGTADKDGPAVARRVEARAQHVDAELEQVQSRRAAVDRSRKRLDRLDDRRRPLLGIEEVAQGRVGPQLHRGGTLRHQRRLIVVRLDGRFADEMIGPESARADRHAVHAFVHVNGRIRRNERAERRELRDARKPPAGNVERMPRRQIRVDARERAEPVRRLQFVFGTARHVLHAVAVLRGFLDEETVLDNRSADGEPRGKTGDPFDDVVFVPLAAEPRIQIVDARLPLVAGAAGLDDDDARRKSSVLDRVRIGKNRDRIDRVVGQREADETHRGIRERRRSDLRA